MRQWCVFTLMPLPGLSGRSTGQAAGIPHGGSSDRLPLDLGPPAPPLTPFPNLLHVQSAGRALPSLGPPGSHWHPQQVSFLIASRASISTPACVSFLLFLGSGFIPQRVVPIQCWELFSPQPHGSQQKVCQPEIIDLSTECGLALGLCLSLPPSAIRKDGVCPPCSPHLQPRRASDLPGPVLHAYTPQRSSLHGNPVRLYDTIPIAQRGN